MHGQYASMVIALVFAIHRDLGIGHVIVPWKEVVYAFSLTHVYNYYLLKFT